MLRTWVLSWRDSDKKCFNLHRPLFDARFSNLAILQNMKVMTMRKILILLELRGERLINNLLFLRKYFSDVILLLVTPLRLSLNHLSSLRACNGVSVSDNQCIVDIANSLSDISCLFLPLSMENKWRKFCHLQKIKQSKYKGTEILRETKFTFAWAIWDIQCLLHMSYSH